MYPDSAGLSITVRRRRVCADIEATQICGDDRRIVRVDKRDRVVIPTIALGAARIAGAISPVVCACCRADIQAPLFTSARTLVHRLLWRKAEAIARAG